MYKGVILSVIIITLIIYIVSESVDFREVFSLLKSIPVYYLFIIVFISELNTVIKAGRFAVLIKESGINISFWQVIKVFVAGQAATQIPGGEVLRGVLLGREGGVAVRKAVAPIISQAYLEFLAPAIVVLFGSFFFPSMFIPALILTAGMVIATLVIISPVTALRIQKMLPNIAVIHKAYQILIKSQEDVKGHFIHSKTGFPRLTFAITFLLALLSNIAGGFLVSFIAYLLGAHLNIIRGAFIYSASLVISGITVLGGIGFTEGGLLGLLLLSNVGFSNAIAIILLFRATTLLLSIILGFIFLGIFYGKALYDARFDFRKL